MRNAPSGTSACPGWVIVEACQRQCEGCGCSVFHVTVCLFITLFFFPVCCLYHRRPAAGTSCCFIPWGDLWPTGVMCFHQILGHLYIKTNLANSSSVLFKHVMRVLYFPFWFPSWWPEMTTLSLSVLPVKYKFFIDPTLVVTCKIKMPESTDLPYGFGIFLHTSEKRKVPNTIRVCILC